MMVFLASLKNYHRLALDFVLLPHRIEKTLTKKDFQLNRAPISFDCATERRPRARANHSILTAAAAMLEKSVGTAAVFLAAHIFVQ